MKPIDGNISTFSGQLASSPWFLFNSLNWSAVETPFGWNFAVCLKRRIYIYCIFHQGASVWGHDHVEHICLACKFVILVNSGLLLHPVFLVWRSLGTVRSLSFVDSGIPMRFYLEKFNCDSSCHVALRGLHCTATFTLCASHFICVLQCNATNGGRPVICMPDHLFRLWSAVMWLLVWMVQIYWQSV